MSGPAPAIGELREAAVEFARAAGAVLREGHGRAHRPERKGRIDLVTEYDRRAERVLLEAIARRFPGHAVLAEESGASLAGGGVAAGGAMDAPAGAGGGEPPGTGGRASAGTGVRAGAGTGGGAPAVRWLVDPLDGTTNYAHNYPFFCVSVAAEVDGGLAAGAIYDPVRDELFAAAAGQGATLNGSPLRVSDIERVEDALLVTGFPYDVREHPERSLPRFEAFLVRAQGIRRDGSAALNLCYLAAGRFDGFWEGHLSPWDMAAGVLIVREAGGTVTNYEGGPFRLERPEILASNGRIHAEMAAILAAARATR